MLKVKWSSAPGPTLKGLLVPTLPLPLVDMEMPLAIPVIVTEPVQTPPVKEGVVEGLIVPDDTVRELVPV